MINNTKTSSQILLDIIYCVNNTQLNIVLILLSEIIARFIFNSSLFNGPIFVLPGNHLDFISALSSLLKEIKNRFFEPNYAAFCAKSNEILMNHLS